MSLLPHFSWLTTFLTLISLLLLYTLYKYILKPYYLISYYQKQGAVGIFHPKLLRHFENVKNAIEKDDYFFYDREVFRKNPQARFIAENFMSNVVLILSDLEMAREYLTKHEIFQKDKDLIRPLANICPEFTFFVEEAEWKKKRKIISSAFNFEFLKNTIPMIVDVSQKKFSEWIKNADLKHSRVFDLFGMITGEVTGRLFFGQKFGKHRVQGKPTTVVVSEVFMKAIMEIPTLSYLIFGPRLMKAGILPRHRYFNKLKADLRDCCRKMIEEAENHPQEEDNLLQHLLNLRKSEDEKDHLTNDQILDEYIGLFAAGTETTASLAASSVYFLWKNPNVFAKVAEEIEREFKDLSTLSLENLNRMEYTSAFLKEALRLGGPTGVVMPRIAVKDSELCGVNVKKGTRIVFRQGLYYWSEKFFPNPKECMPERWLPKNDVVANEPYAFIPFLAGPRNCLGQHLAIIEAKVILGLFIKRFKFSFPEDYKFRLVVRFSFSPLKPLIATLEPKNESQ